MSGRREREWDGAGRMASAGKGACRMTLMTEMDPGNPCENLRREPTSQKCPFTSTYPPCMHTPVFSGVRAHAQ